MANPSSSTHTGWYHDRENSILDAYYQGTKALEVSTSGFGYGTGVGSTVTQITNRSTGVTINAVCGTITGDATSLAAEATATFTVTNNKVAIGDVPVIAVRSGPTSGATSFRVTAVAAGSFDISATNNNVAAGTADTGAPVINFVIIKAVSA